MVGWHKNPSLGNLPLPPKKKRRHLTVAPHGWLAGFVMTNHLLKQYIYVYIHTQICAIQSYAIFIPSRVSTDDDSLIEFTLFRLRRIFTRRRRDRRVAALRRRRSLAGPPTLVLGNSFSCFLSRPVSQSVNSEKDGENQTDKLLPKEKGHSPLLYVSMSLSSSHLAFQTLTIISAGNHVITNRKFENTSNPMKTPNRRIGTIWHIAFEKKATIVVKDVAPIALTPCRKVQDIRATARACGSEGLDIIAVNTNKCIVYAIEQRKERDREERSKGKNRQNREERMCRCMCTQIDTFKKNATRAKKKCY